ncbi:helix-turn-helix domain-containing protein [Allopusillimonas soli]|uniref:DJ-1/PfpI family protein n=1 Tax=Allopusillimonas soli TaxID=659016 RepID=A0A853FCI1_9BURK|nr:helix-turn-helix domain-containing protein [Allopusillimonas soli]NYT36570.1 DJ-1/PfpI family protein [Allopusillimonas soli]TEA75064.1 helix-turn-helix domain-containing protein [Allopusillimonas soli]
MSKLLNVAILVFPACQALDVTGPAAVFEAGNFVLGSAYYKVHILAAKSGAIQTNSAVRLMARSISDLSPHSVDTLLIAGGSVSGLESMVADDRVRKWVVLASRTARRYGSVCTGTFALAHFGLLDGKRVATHWSACADLAAQWPNADVDKQSLFVNVGRLWTSAGVTTGIDMSLDMVASDLGNAVANGVAKRLVLYARRPGYQSQFSPVLSAQSQADAPFAALVLWMRENLSKQLDVPRLAEKVYMSERTFVRHFIKSIGETPARFVETLRLDEARSLFATSMSIKEIAARTGYATGAQLSKAFNRRFGMSPQLFRELHCYRERE